MNRKNMINKILIALWFAIIPAALEAAIRLPVIFQSNMVLQRDTKVADTLPLKTAGKVFTYPPE